MHVVGKPAYCPFLWQAEHCCRRVSARQRKAGSTVTEQCRPSGRSCCGHTEHSRGNPAATCNIDLVALLKPCKWLRFTCRRRVAIAHCCGRPNTASPAERPVAKAGSTLTEQCSASRLGRAVAGCASCWNPLQHVRIRCSLKRAGGTRCTSSAACVLPVVVGRPSNSWLHAVPVSGKGYCW